MNRDCPKAEVQDWQHHYVLFKPMIGQLTDASHPGLVLNSDPGV